MGASDEPVSPAAADRDKALRHIDNDLRRLGEEADQQALKLLSYLLGWARMDIEDQLNSGSCDREGRRSTGASET